MRTVKYFVTVGALALAACQHTEPGIRTIEVEVPVPQPCLSEEQLAEERFQEPPMIGAQITGLPENAERERDLLAASAVRLRIWGRTLLAPLQACAE